MKMNPKVSALEAMAMQVPSMDEDVEAKCPVCGTPCPECNEEMEEEEYEEEDED